MTRAEKLLAEFKKAFPNRRAGMRRAVSCGFEKDEATKIQRLRRRALRLKDDEEAARRTRLAAELTASSFAASRYKSDDGSFPVVDADEILAVMTALYGKRILVEKFV